MRQWQWWSYHLSMCWYVFTAPLFLTFFSWCHINFPTELKLRMYCKHRGTQSQEGMNWPNTQTTTFYLKCLLPLDGSGKTPWLLLLMTEGFGDCWLLWLAWDLPWSMLSVCSFSGYHRGVLSRWDVLDRSINTCRRTRKQERAWVEL